MTNDLKFETYRRTVDCEQHGPGSAAMMALSQDEDYDEICCSCHVANLMDEIRSAEEVRSFGGQEARRYIGPPRTSLFLASAQADLHAYWSAKITEDAARLGIFSKPGVMQ